MMQSRPRVFSCHDVAGRSVSPWFPEAQFLVLCARTSVSHAVRLRIRDSAQQPMNWPLVLDLARYHGVGPLLNRTINAVCSDLVPEESLNALRQVTQAGTILNRVLAQELIQLCRAFSRNAVPVIPFKGATLAASAYGDLALRDFDDLDFIVPQHRLADAQRVLWSEGYRPRHRSDDDLDAAHADEPYHVFVKRDRMFRVDLQWVMAHEQFAFRLDRAEIWQRLALLPIQGTHVRALAPEDLLIVLCVHGSKHAWERLKWVADVSELIRGQRLDWKRVFAIATRWNCRRMLLLGLALAHQVMEVSLPPDIQDEVRRDADVSSLASRMPKNLLALPQDGIDEHDGPALYLALKDTWWARWYYGLVLLRHDHPILDRMPAWCRWSRPLVLLARMTRWFRASPLLCLVVKIARRPLRSHKRISV